MDQERHLINSSWARRWLLGLAVLLTVALVYALRSVLVPLLLAFLVAYALDPLVDRLVRWRVPRPLAAVFVVTGMLLLLLGVLVTVVPSFVQQFQETASTVPAKALRLRDRVEPWMWATFHIRVPRTPGEIAMRTFDALRAQGPMIVGGLSGALTGTFRAIALSVGVLIVPVFTIYLLIDFDAVVTRSAKLVPRRFYPKVSAIAAHIHGTLGHYIRGQVTANIVLATLYALGLYIVGLPLAIPIGVLTGMFAFVPYVGFGVFFSLAVSLSVLEGQGILHVIGVVTVMGAVQLLDAFIITPRVVGGAVGLKPIEVLLTMMAAGTLFGFFGVLLAVPIGAVIKILLHHATEAYLSSEYYLQNAPGQRDHEVVVARAAKAVTAAATERIASAPPPAP